MPRRCTNIVKQNGRDVHLVNQSRTNDCVVNSGLGSVRGPRIAEMSYSETTGTQRSDLTDPMVGATAGSIQPSWDDALEL